MVKPDPKKAKKLVEVGESREKAGDMMGALTAYEEAARYAPFDVTIVSRSVALRGKLVQSYAREAERQAIVGDVNGATEAMAMALHIDPTNDTLKERLGQLQSMGSSGDDTGLPPEQPTENLPKAQAQKGVHSFNMKNVDVRGAYEQIATVFGVKAVFDPELPARMVKYRVENVDFDTALKVLSAQTGTFWRPVSKGLIFVAQDTTEKRKAYDLEMEQTFALPASLDTTEIADVVRTVREMTGLQHIQQSVEAHTISARGPVQKVRLAGQIVKAVEQTRGEVLLEMDFLEVNHDDAVKMGITPPASARLIPLTADLASQVKSASTLTQLLTLVATVFGGAAGSVAAGTVASLGSIVPPFAVVGGGKTTFLLTMPTFTANFSKALSLVQSGNQLLLRAQDGKPATFFIGERYPVTLSLLSSSLGTSALTPAVGGTSTTLQTQQFTVGQGPVSMVTSDFRQSGQRDLAVLNEIDNTVSILLNEGGTTNPQFVAATGSPISVGAARSAAPAVPASLATGSFNTTTDSYPDLLVTDPVNNDVVELLGNGDGTFTVQTATVATGNEPSSIVVGQFNTNKDANYGFVVTNFTDNTYSVYTGNADGTFTQVTGSPFALGSTEKGPYAIASGDFNSDGIPDLAIVNQTSGNVAILQGIGDGTFKEFAKSPVAVGNLPVAIATGSLSASTGPGLVVVNQKDNTVSVLLGNGDGSFTPASQSPLATSSSPSGVAIGAFLQSSTAGFAVTNTGSGTVTVYLDLGSGLFTEAIEPSAGTNPYAVLAGSFSNGTYPDVVVTNNLSGSAGQVTMLISPTSLISNATNAQTPYPGSEYVDLGLKVKVTPYLNEQRQVTMQLDFEIRALSGSSFNGIPVISNRSVSQTVRVREDEPSILTGLLNMQETKGIVGIPGLATLPGIGYAFGTRSKTVDDTELLVILTPRRVRAPQRIDKTIYAGRGDTGGRGSIGANAPLAPPPANPEPAPAQPGGEPAQPGQEPTTLPPAPTPTPAPAPGQGQEPGQEQPDTQRPQEPNANPPAEPPQQEPNPQPPPANSPATQPENPPQR